MKTISLTLIAISIFLTLIIFIIFIYSINLEMESQLEYERNSVDYDPDLSLSYVPLYYQALQFNSIFVAAPIMLGAISLTLIIPNIILRIKKIPTKKYMLIISAGILIFFGSSWVENGLTSLLTLEHLEQETDWMILIGGLVPISIGTIFIIPAIILLKKAKLRKRKL